VVVPPDEELVDRFLSDGIRVRLGRLVLPAHRYRPDRRLTILQVAPIPEGCMASATLICPS
jgi:hypothetical protein